MIDHSELLPEGREIGGFRIEKAIGHGNMGIIYRAIQINLNRPVALKILFKSVAEDQDFVRSFFREAQAAAAFTHQNIVQAFDVGQTNDGIYYFAMELIEGGDISLQLKSRGIYDPIEAMEKMLGVADGLDYGSTLRKLTHGDIKPANIMITKANTFKLADLGLARMGGEIQGESDGIMLTPLYAAPEMINGSWVVGDPRADMYSVGATLYQMMHGEPPFNDDNYHKVIQMQLQNKHKPLRDLINNFPSNISKLVDRFLEKDPDDRFKDWAEAKHAMELALKDPHGTNTKKKKRVIHYNHSKDENGEHNSASENSSHRSVSRRKKKKSNTPIVISIVALLIICGLGFFAMNMKKDVVGQQYKELTGRFTDKQPEAIIKMIESFVERHGATPPAAAADLAKYKEMLDTRSLFSANDLTHQQNKIAEFETQYKKKNPNVLENFRFNLTRIENDLNSNLQTNNLIFHLPFNKDIDNHASFYSPKKVKVNNGSLSYVTAKVDKGINFTGQSIMYGDVSRLRFSSKAKFTISFWIKPKQMDSPILGKCEIVDKKISRGYLFSLSKGKFQAEFFEDADNKKLAIRTNEKLSSSNWNHIVLQYDGKSATIHLNGIEASTETFANSLSGDFSCTGPFVVGFSNMKATLDDIRFWSKNLTAKELKELNGFRSITDLEKLTGRYQNIKKKILSAKFNLNTNTDDNTDKNSDTGPKNQDEINHPQYSEYLESLQRLKQRLEYWKEEAETVAKFSGTIAKDLKDQNKGFRIISNNVRSAKQEFYRFLTTHKKLIGLSISQGKYKGLRVDSVNEKEIILIENSGRLGRIKHRFYSDDPKSLDGFNAVISTMLSNGMFKPTNHGPYIFAMLIGNELHYQELSQMGKFPVIINALQRDLSQQ